MGQLLRVFFTQTDFTFWSLACLIPNIHSLCSGFPETREVNFSLHEIKTQPLPHCLPSWLDTTEFLWTLRGFHTQPSPSWGETYKQWEITGLWALWENMTPIPQAAMSGIHRGDRAWWSPHCPTACGGKVLLPQAILSQRTTATPPPLPDEEPGLTHVSLILDSNTGVHIHCQGYLYFLCACFYQCPLFSLLPDSLLSSDSSRTLAKPLQPTALFSFPDPQKHMFANCISSIFQNTL